jgi:hypothetical protein
MRERLQNLEKDGDTSTIRTARKPQYVRDAGYDDDNDTIVTRVKSSKAYAINVRGISKPSFEFETQLEESRVYKRVFLETCDVSFATTAIRPRAWSVFTGISLSEISVISAIALPLSIEEFLDCDWYETLKTASTTLHVRRTEGRDFYVQVNCWSETVLSLKEKIRQRTYIAHMRQQLMCGDEKLLDDKLLVHYGLSTSSVLTLVELYPTSITLEITIEHDRQLTFAMNKAATILQLIHQIEKRTGIPSDIQLLYWEGTYISMDDTLDALNRKTRLEWRRLSLRLSLKLAREYVIDITFNWMGGQKNKHKTHIFKFIKDLKNVKTMPQYWTIPSEQLYFFWNGKLLEDHSQLMSYGIRGNQYTYSCTETEILVLNSFPGLSWYDLEIEKLLSPSVSGYWMSSLFTAELCKHCSSCTHHEGMACLSFFLGQVVSDKSCNRICRH